MRSRTDGTPALPIPAFEFFQVRCLRSAVEDQEVEFPQLEPECLRSIHTV